MSIVSTIKMTAKQFLQLGEDPPGVRLELVNGEVAVSPSPIPDHSHVLVQLTFLLEQHIRRGKLGRLFLDVDTLLGEFDVRRPDVLFFSTARLHLVGKAAMEGPPDLCVEIISPSSVTIDRRDKLKLYEKGGVQNYWIVDPAARTIEAYTLMHGKYHGAGKGSADATVHLPPFEDLALPLGELWQPDLT